MPSQACGRQRHGVLLGDGHIEIGSGYSLLKRTSTRASARRGDAERAGSAAAMSHSQSPKIWVLGPSKTAVFLTSRCSDRNGRRRGIRLIAFGEIVPLPWW